MKKAIILIVIILCSASLYSAEPVVKFYLQDGSSKQYNLSDIENMKFSSAPNILQLHIFKNNGKNLYYPAQLIDSIKFAIDSRYEDKLHLWHDGFIWDIAIHEIDSILLYYTTYTAVTIGEQHWMYKNLNVDHYRNGDSIDQASFYNWVGSKKGAWCYYKDNPLNGVIYGKLYNWFAVTDIRELAPVGWHIPTNEELIQLSDFLGWDSISGGKLKEIDTLHWKSPNIGATNESGFTGLPGGYRSLNSLYDFINTHGAWWSTSENSIIYAWGFFLINNSPKFNVFYEYKQAGYSVRCIKN